MKKILFLLLAFFAFPVFAQATNPVILFSDMTDGPSTGWDASATQGAAVTIWCRNVGTSRGSSYVTVTNGASSVNLTTDGDYLEWGATGDSVYPKVRLGMQRISFFLNSSMITTGTFPNSTITVTVGGVTSGTLKFHVRALGTSRIYFFATDGNNAAAGNLATPKQTTAWARANLVQGDVAYFRAGRWSAREGDHPSIMDFTLTHGEGIEGNSITIKAYPGEEVHFGNAIGTYPNHASTSNEFVVSTYASNTLKYWTFSNMYWEAYFGAVQLAQGVTNGWSNLRFVGLDIQTCYTGNLTGSAGCGYEIQAGGQGGSYFYMLGNFIHDLGSDGYMGSDTRTMYRRIYSFYFGGYGNPHHIYLGWNEFGWNQNGRGFQFYGHGSTDTLDNAYMFNNFVHNQSRQGGCIGGGQLDFGPAVEYSYIQTFYYYNNIMDVPGPEDYVLQINDMDQSLGANGGTFYIYNNTLRNWSGNAYRVLQITDPTHLYLRNNIIITNSTANVYTSELYNTNSVGNNNNYYGLTGAHKPSWDSSTLDPSDPILVTSPPVTSDYAGYSIQVTSLARNAGADLSADIPSVQVAGVNIPGVSTDFLGGARGTTPDIGAFEYDSGEGTTPPSATGCTIQGGNYPK